MSNVMNILQILSRISNDNILNRSFNDQGGSSKPCSSSFVNSLEKVVITNEDIDNGLCCAICQEEFKMGEKVIKLPCKDPHYFHYETPEDECGGILPWLKEHNSCPICREEFPEEESDVPEENIDISEPTVNDPNLDNNTDPIINSSDTEEHINERIDDMIQRLFTIRRNNSNNELFNPRNSIYIPNHNNSMNGSNSSGITQLPTIMDLPPLINISPPMIIHMNNYSEEEDPALQEAIRQSLES